ncbi:ABC transporter ATP-binding protein [Stomatohabitans albus]|uniref:ABC transporter ATP-binding protein n=1 Tax=Stomatohabitans albus TaxID=3110766 RepID=UPI00300C0225
MIKINQLTFSYTNDPFINDLNLNIKPGECFGFLGPSGAGKSTIQHILIGLLTNYQGSVEVDNTEIRTRKNTFYERIGVMFEYPTLYNKYSARHNLEFFGSLYNGRTRDIDTLLDRVGLLSHADKKVGAFSKGMRTRLCFVKAIMHNPVVLFLDEPTSGLDPTNSSLLKSMIKEEQALGTTIVMTTHNMADATDLCDRVAFIVDGAIAATDTPTQFMRATYPQEVTYTAIEEGVEVSHTIALSTLSKDPIFLEHIHQNTITSIHSSEITLGDVFIRVTGKRLS